MGELNKVLAPEQYKNLLDTRESDHVSLLAACQCTQHEQDMLAEDVKFDHQRLCKAVLSLNTRDASVKGAVALPAKHESSEPRLKKRKANTSTLGFPRKNMKGKANQFKPWWRPELFVSTQSFSRSPDLQAELQIHCNRRCKPLGKNLAGDESLDFSLLETQLAVM